MSTAVSEESAVFVHGIGWIAQYDSYLNTFWEKGVGYFLRDVKFAELQTLLDDTAQSSKHRSRRIRKLVADLNVLNRGLARSASST